MSLFVKNGEQKCKLNSSVTTAAVAAGTELYGLLVPGQARRGPADTCPAVWSSSSSLGVDCLMHRNADGEL